ncbi:hypothetical protein GCM10009416_43600 [Craurococcus roseus]|uniref:Serine protease n=1 Tax=Craurococcus roseus TaxID=77585 RepID=A0ABN1FZ94_9PROT
MELGSVRALKAEVEERVVRPFVAEALASGRIGMAARSLSTATRRQPGIALGVTRGRGKGDFRLAIRVQRPALIGPELVGRIAEMARGEHDLRVIGRVRKRAAAPKPWHQSRQRPLLLGSSIGHVDVTAGTLGAVAWHRRTDQAVVLSNNHVLANEDRGEAGDPILQPGAADGGRRPGAVIGRLLAAVPLRRNGGNRVDAAIGELDERIRFDALTLTGLGALDGVRAEPLLPGDRVAKVGRTTGLTRGRVSAVEVDGVVVGFETGDLSFDGQIEVEGVGGPFSAGGDSGSLVVDSDLRACGLLFAGSDRGGSGGLGLTFLNEIAPVLRGLGLSLDLAPAMA